LDLARVHDCIKGKIKGIGSKAAAGLNGNGGRQISIHLPLGLRAGVFIMELLYNIFTDGKEDFLLWGFP
jgi:hypothetical protein